MLIYVVTIDPCACTDNPRTEYKRKHDTENIHSTEQVVSRFIHKHLVWAEGGGGMRSKSSLSELSIYMSNPSVSSLDLAPSSFVFQEDISSSLNLFSCRAIRRISNKNVWKIFCGLSENLHTYVWIQFVPPIGHTLSKMFFKSSVRNSASTRQTGEEWWINCYLSISYVTKGWSVGFFAGTNMRSRGTSTLVFGTSSSTVPNEYPFRGFPPSSPNEYKNLLFYWRRNIRSPYINLWRFRSTELPFLPTFLSDPKNRPGQGTRNRGSQSNVPFVSRLTEYRNPASWNHITVIILSCWCITPRI